MAGVVGNGNTNSFNQYTNEKQASLPPINKKMTSSVKIFAGSKSTALANQIANKFGVENFFKKLVWQRTRSVLSYALNDVDTFYN